MMSTELGPLAIHVENRAYDLHRPVGCTVVVLERRDWPGNEFGFWLPESVASWGNWQGEHARQDWELFPGGRGRCVQRIPEMEFTSTFAASHGGDCLWFDTTVTNRTEETRNNTWVQSCFHFVNAPEFISIRGERLWACLDGVWTTTDNAPRQEAEEPRRVKFLREGMRTERTVVNVPGFPHGIMPQAATHPLFITESFDHQKSVGVASEHFHHLFNNNDCILRCLHSHPQPIPELAPGESGTIRGLVIFCNGDHEALLKRYEELLPAGKWPPRHDV